MSRSCWCGNCADCRYALNVGLAAGAFSQDREFHENNPHLAGKFFVGNFFLLLFFLPVGWNMDFKTAVTCATVGALLSPYWGLSITILTVMFGLLGVWVN